ncbi:hypothetical protein F5X68DRAFT_260456 [Plectosphaerella plurivora]|uniref:Uncharacterized protein n=1 Tax=Plectosphaerella plurivora TaxID=936078 RepID=A0A9P8VE64_9PEZI|nr:hypothetical protein F5X68DRAFT_260456 [Plectosphaerella plurivora]
MSPAFLCPQCPKQFTSQGSRARHLQNHSHSARHLCSVCGVTFRRRDLLTRHMKLHGPEPQASDSSPSATASATAAAPDASPRASPVAVEAVAAAPRKRCHTACNRCRDLKVKCDGRSPCSRCRTASKPCDFGLPSTRMSRMTAPSFSSLEGDDLAPTLQDIGGGAIAGGDDLDLDADPFDPTTLLWDSAYVDITPWPWLHENLFLSGGAHGPTDAQDLVCSAESFSALLPPSDIFQQDMTARGTAAEPVALDAAVAATQPTLQHTHQNESQAQDNSTAQQFADDGSTNRKRAVDELVMLAANATADGSLPSQVIKPKDLWTRASFDLTSVFGLKPDSQGIAGTPAVLGHFLDLYKAHFHQLWPLVPRRNLDTSDMHPLLYLALASIGAMYMGRPGSDCGSALHNAVRRRVVLPIELDDSDDNLVWLAQVRLITQVAALYFGQPRAFTYAQHLGTLLTAQARRMCLFSATHHRQRVSQFKRSKGAASDGERLASWLAIEERRRLAFGILRGDTFTSVLLNTKPLVTLDEVGLEFPSCDAVYNGSHLDPRLALDIIEHDRALSRDVRACDVYHILLETDEPLPPLEPVAHEILLFGLQPLVWRFSHDHQLLEGLTGGRGYGHDQHNHHHHQHQYGAEPGDRGDARRRHQPPLAKKRRRETFTSEADSLDSRSYEMADLVSERRRLDLALSKWERALPLVKTFARTDEERSYVLSSLILYHLSLLRLYAPVEDVHQIHYRMADHRPVPSDVVASVQAWARSPKARTAVERVRSVWSLITQQTQGGRTRSRFNFNAYVGLHHGAAILWAYNGARDHDQASDSSSATSDSPGAAAETAGSSPTFSLRADGAEFNALLKTFADLFHAISPAQWLSFAEVTGMLGTLEFPHSPSRQERSCAPDEVVVAAGPV